MFPIFFSRKHKQNYSRVSNGWEAGGEVMPVVDDIPRFVKTGSYASLFGDQWKRYTKTQLDSYTGVPISKQRLERCLGNLRDNLQNKVMLEAGCGAGRFTEILLEKGTNLVSADLTSAVEANKENCPVTDRHLIIQADINDMPFSDGSFEIVLCIGVIQHTPNPDQTIENLYNLVKPGGTLIIDHYTYGKSYMFRLAPFYRRFLRKMPPEKTIPYTQRLVNRYLPWHKRFANSKILSVLLNRISPVASYYRTIPDLNDQQQVEWSLLDTHDSLTDYFKHFRSKPELVSLMKRLGAINIWCEYGGNGVELRCNKPLQ